MRKDELEARCTAAARENDDVAHANKLLSEKIIIMEEEKNNLLNENVTFESRLNELQISIQEIKAQYKRDFQQLWHKFKWKWATQS